MSNRNSAGVRVTSCISRIVSVEREPVATVIHQGGPFPKSKMGIGEGEEVN